MYIKHEIERHEGASSKWSIMIDKIKIREKGDWAKWWHYIVPVFVWIVGIFNSNFKDQFYNQFLNAIGDTIYYPKGFEYDHEKHFGVIRHEMRHIYDWSCCFVIGYLLSKRRRLHWELRGYAQNLAHEYFMKGEISELHFNHVVEMLESDMYLNMTDNARPYVKKIVNIIKQSDYDSFNFVNERLT